MNWHDQSYSKFITTSVILHLGIVAFFYLGVKTIFAPTKLEKYNLNLIQASVKVDVVAMPKLTVQELKELNGQSYAPEVEELEPAKEEAVDKDSFKVEKKKKLSLAERLKKYSKNVDSNLKKIKPQKVIKNKNNNSQLNKKLKNLVLEGNKLSKGESFVGSDLGASRNLLVTYKASLPTYVRQNWNLPSYLAEQELQCRIKILISESGRILRADIIESSGNQDYDSLAMKAIERTQFPIPAKEIVKSLSRTGVVLGFPL